MKNGILLSFFKSKVGGLRINDRIINGGKFKPSNSIM
jgi:hypothetical protein